jgi:uncharacterized protein YndB with AHSA1/START domain
VDLDRIERETVIEASPERVWALVATPGFWVAEESSVAGTTAVEGESLVAKNPNVGDVAVRVERVDPPRRVAYRWASAFPGEELRGDNSTLVEFFLSAEGAGTRLRVVESGFAALRGPSERRSAAIRSNTDGWSQVFDALIERAQRSPV